jgi:transketolase
MKTAIDDLCINTIRFLAVDAVEKAQSGHPGTPMGAATMAYVLWERFLKHNPTDPKWPDRDRFVLSVGHASMLLYALLYLTGYDLKLNDIKRFRQWASRTPGHVEHGLTPGVEASTGPLGQGFANGVGMAIAEQRLDHHYNRPRHDIINHYTYAIVSDGDLEEGVSAEAASLAGTLHLGKLIYLYDSNNITIEGNTNLAFTENVAQRFLAYNWQVIGPIDGMDILTVDTAIRTAQAEQQRPSLIICQTIIGYGSPHKAGTAAAHGEPLGEEEVRLTKQNLGWPYKQPFTVPPEVLAQMRQAQQHGATWQQDWQARLDAYRVAYADEARQLQQDLSGELPEGWDSGLDRIFSDEKKPVATRDASGKVLNILTARVHSLVGGAADLGTSIRTIVTEGKDFSAADYCGQNMHFGVREHAMGGIASGMALHGGLIPYAGTFLIFYDYMRPPVRLAALMGLHVIYVFSHDSIGLGEDGPSHQPVEQLMALRTVPGLVTIRPADATETAEAWKIALAGNHHPTAIVLTRQRVPVLDRKKLAGANGVQHGGYTLWEAAPAPEIILIGSGSEVHIALEAGKKLKEQGIAARVVSLPSWAIFDAQPEPYRRQVLPPKVRARVSIEAASPIGWERYVGLDGVAIGVNRFGASAPGEVLFEKLGLTATHMVEVALKLLAEKKR